jgi:hypothetical protein
VRGFNDHEAKTANDNERQELMLDSHGVVYSAVCRTCQLKGVMVQYIGETGRKLKIRLKEHCANVLTGKDPPKSAIAEHSILCHGEQPNLSGWMISILHHSKRTQDRRALEALEILKKHPTANKDKGVNIVMSGAML